MELKAHKNIKYNRLKLLLAYYGEDWEELGKR